MSIHKMEDGLYKIRWREGGRNRSLWVHGGYELAKKVERKKMSARDENRHLDQLGSNSDSPFSSSFSNNRTTLFAPFSSLGSEAWVKSCNYARTRASNNSSSTIRSCCFVSN